MLNSQLSSAISAPILPTKPEDSGQTIQRSHSDIALESWISDFSPVRYLGTHRGSLPSNGVT